MPAAQSRCPQQRQRLAFTLWPDSSESQARTNLRHVLHNLRRALPDADRFIDACPRTLRWRPEAPLWLDVVAFERALAEGRLEDAVDVYGGELLAGSYDDWVLEERERLGHLCADALERLAQRLESYTPTGPHPKIDVAARAPADVIFGEMGFRAAAMRGVAGEIVRCVRSFERFIGGSQTPAASPSVEQARTARTNPIGGPMKKLGIVRAASAALVTAPVAEARVDSPPQAGASARTSIYSGYSYAGYAQRSTTSTSDVPTRIPTELARTARCRLRLAAVSV